MIHRENPQWSMTDVDPVSRVVQLRPGISWRGIFAGVFVGILAYLGLTALGLAFGAIGLGEAIEAGSGGVALSIGFGIWMLLTVLASLFIGGYAAARASGVIPSRIGGITGLVVAGIFFVAMVIGLYGGLGAVGAGAGSLIGTIGGGVADLAGNQRVQTVMEQATGNLSFRSEPGVVLQGVTSRLLQGNEEAAASYFAREAGISSQEANQRLAQVKGQVVSTAKEVGQAAANAAQAAAWIFFGMILLGSAAGLFGGALAAGRNIREPLTERDRKMVLDSHHAWTGLSAPEEPVVVRET